MIRRDDLSSYRELVARLAASADRRVIYNETIEHATILLENLFRVAKKEVLILTGNLPPAVYGSPEIIEAAVKFLKEPGTYVKIISELPLTTTHPFLAALEGRGLSARVYAKVISSDEMNQIPCHFMVADAQHFRFERDKREFGAVTQFGQGESGSKLKTMFDKFFNATPA